MNFKQELLERHGKNATRIRTLLAFINPSDHVLDIGCVQHSLVDKDWRDPPRYSWLHADLVRQAESVIGLDLVEEGIENMNSAGYDAIVGDAESFDLNQVFDVIVAGELIEHLSNPGQFLECCYEHLNSDGRLILSTPNPVNFENILWHVRGTQESKINSEHTAWFEPVVLSELASREGFRITGVESYSTGIFPLSAFILRQLGLFEPLHSGGYIYELRLK